MIPVIFGLIGQLVLQNKGNQIYDVIMSWPVLVGVCLAFAIVVFKSIFTYRKLTYDPTWILKYQETFDNMKAERSLAAKTLKKYNGKLNAIDKYGEQLSNIDEVLDVISDIGFYVKGDQISPEVAYNHFYHWVRGYWIASHDYIKAYQTKQPKAWDSFEPLFEVLCEIEIGKHKERRAGESSFTPEELNEFLVSEMIPTAKKKAKRKKA